MCRAHIQAFAKGAEQYAFETNLSQRVAHWQQRLAPQLEEEEKRQVFDIHLYGAKVIHTMEDALKGMKLSDDIDEFESTPEFTGRNIVSFKSGMIQTLFTSQVALVLPLTLCLPPSYTRRTSSRGL